MPLEGTTEIFMALWYYIAIHAFIFLLLALLSAMIPIASSGMSVEYPGAFYEIK